MADLTTDPPQKKLEYEPIYKKWSVFSLFFFPALGGFIFGYDIGATSFVVVQLQSEAYSGVSWYSIVAESALLQGIVTSGAVGGAFLASLLVFSMSESLGRRGEMLVASALYLSGGLLQVLSAVNGLGMDLGITVLVSGRIVFGMGIGFAMHAAPIYISEMAPSAVRGLLISSKEGMIVVGMVAGYVFGDVFSHTPGGWAATYALVPATTIAYACGVCFLPESARWLGLTGRTVESLESLRFVYSSGAEGIAKEVEEVAQASHPPPTAPSPGSPAAASAAAAYAQVLASGSDDDGNSSYQARRPGADAVAKQTPLQVLFGPRVWPATLAGLGVITLQQITGQPSVLYYAETIFDQAGVSSSGTIGVAGFKLLCTLGSAFVVDSQGRRKMLIVGILLMMVALSVITMYFAFEWDSDVTLILAMFVYVGGYQVGFGPMAWLLISEIFPLSVRGEGMALAVQTNFFWNLVVTLSFSSEIKIIGAAWSFGIFLILLVFSLVFVWRYVPETKGLTLEQIEAMLDSATFSPAQRAAGKAKGNYEAVGLLDSDDGSPLSGPV